MIMIFQRCLLSLGLLIYGALPGLTQDIRPVSRIDVHPFPLGQLALADSVVDFRPRLADLGIEPDTPSAVTDSLPGYTLEDGGWITWRFMDNCLLDGHGDDLEVLGTWPQEGTLRAWISHDSRHFLPLGVVPLQNHRLDLASTARAGQFYTLVRLRYTAPPSGEAARIVNVAALNGPGSFVIPGERLFEGRSATPSAMANETLATVAKTIRLLNPLRVTIEGHLDPRGDADYLLALSQSQADTVATRLMGLTLLDPLRFVAVGLGADEQMDTVDLSESELLNLRRIRILVTPQRETQKPEGQCP